MITMLALNLGSLDTGGLLGNTGKLTGLSTGDLTSLSTEDLSSIM